MVSYRHMDHVTPHHGIVASESSRKDVRAALGALYERQHVRMLRFATARLGDVESGRDAVNDTFVRALTRLSALRDPQAMESWVWSILLNETRRHNRLRKSRPSESLDGDPDIEAPVEPKVDHDLRRLVRDLPDRQRTVLFLKHYGDLSGPEIAEILGIAPVTVRTTLHQAHAALRHRLTEGSPPHG